MQIIHILRTYEYVTIRKGLKISDFLFVMRNTFEIGENLYFSQHLWFIFYAGAVHSETEVDYNILDRVENRFGSNIRSYLSLGSISIYLLNLSQIQHKNDPATSEAIVEQMRSIVGLILFQYIVLTGKLNYIYLATFHCELELNHWCLKLMCYFLSFIHLVREDILRDMLRDIRSQKIKDANLDAVAGAVVKSNDVVVKIENEYPHARGL